MIRVLAFILTLLVTGCQSVGSKIAVLPSVGFDPIMGEPQNSEKIVR